MKKDIQKIVAYYVRKCGSQNPFDIAKYLNIQVQIGDLGSRCGCYMYLKKHRCIFLNETLSEGDRIIVMAHELGHAIMHKKDNCYFIRNKTLLNNSKIEKEANEFAIALLLPVRYQEPINYRWAEQVSRVLNYKFEFIKLSMQQRLEN